MLYPERAACVAAVSQTGVEPAAFPLGVGAEIINPRQK